MKQFDLLVVNDIRKSFYGQATIQSFAEYIMEFFRDCGMGIQQRQ